MTRPRRKPPEVARRDEEYRKALGLGPDDDYPSTIGVVSPGSGRSYEKRRGATTTSNQGKKKGIR